VIVVGEIRQGIERVRARDPRQGAALEKWLREAVQSFGQHILPVDNHVAQTWGRLSAAGTFPVIDALMAATAHSHGLTLATRNVKDIARTGVDCLDPFKFGATA